MRVDFLEPFSEVRIGISGLFVDVQSHDWPES